MWISAIEMPGEVSEAVGDSLEAHVIEGSLLEAVGRAFGVEVDRFRPFLKEPKCASAEVRDSLSMIAAAQFYYRNYQDESLYAKAVRYLATGVRPAAWDAETKEAIAHYDRYGGRELIGKSPVMATLQDTRPRPHPRRKRHRQGNRRPADTHEEPEMQDAVRCLQLRERDERAP